MNKAQLEATLDAITLSTRRNTRHDQTLEMLTWYRVRAIAYNRHGDSETKLR
jgi:hypothetical protein